MRRALFGVLLLVFAGEFVIWRYQVSADPVSTISFRIGQEFEEVVDSSSYSVLDHSDVPNGTIRAGGTFVTKPAVILHFNDPEHAFSLPPTRFAVVGYIHNKVSTVATSPMLRKLPFDEAVAILENLQTQLKEGGWEPWVLDGSDWFDLSSVGKKILYDRMFDPGSQQTTLRIPNKYGMVLRLWCAEGCMERKPPYLFMIDVGVGPDVYASIR